MHNLWPAKKLRAGHSAYFESYLTVDIDLGIAFLEQAGDI
jgi:hypothetical protein